MRAGVTQWHRPPMNPATEKPVAAGVYVTEFDSESVFAVMSGLSNWDGERWGPQYHSASDAYDNRDKPGRQDKRWRSCKKP